MKKLILFFLILPCLSFIIIRGEGTPDFPNIISKSHPIIGNGDKPRFNLVRGDTLFLAFGPSKDQFGVHRVYRFNTLDSENLVFTSRTDFYITKNGVYRLEGYVAHTFPYPANWEIVVNEGVATSLAESEPQETLNIRQIKDKHSVEIHSSSALIGGVYISTIDGKLIHQQMSGNPNNEILVETNHMNSGYYVFVVQFQNNMILKKKVWLE